MTAGASTDTARSAGRGGLAILGAKIYFMLIGLVQQIALKAILGLSGYGAYSTAQGVASITYNPIVQASIQGASREISAAPEELRPGLTRHLLLLHTRGALALAGLFFLLAHPTARVLGAPHVGRTLQILSVVVLMYGVYAPLIGVLNGLRRFLPQALLDVAAATLRTLGLLAGAYAATRLLQPGDMVAVEGANVGFALASLLILGCALVITGWGKPAGRPLVAREYATFVLPVLGGQVLQNLLFQADSLLLRKFASEAALAAGLDGAAADPFVGDRKSVV